MLVSLFSYNTFHDLIFYKNRKCLALQQKYLETEDSICLHNWEYTSSFVLALQKCWTTIMVHIFQDFWSVIYTSLILSLRNETAFLVLRKLVNFSNNIIKMGQCRDDFRITRAGKEVKYWWKIGTFYNNDLQSYCVSRKWMKAWRRTLR